MNKLCTTHGYRGGSLAWRLILAEHTLDSDAGRHVDDEIGDCIMCWRDTAMAAATAADLAIAARLPASEFDESGLLWGPAAEAMLTAITRHLRAERHRRDYCGPGDE